MSSTANRIIYLEGLRGIAALVVVFEHLMKMFYPNAFSDQIILTNGDSAWRWLSYPPFNMLHNGAWAVTLFFVLSAYVLALKYFHNEAPSFFQTAKTIFARYIRLAVPVAASFLIVAILIQVNAFNIDEVTSKTGLYTVGIYDDSLRFMDALYLGFIKTMFYGSMDYNPPVWTISLEMYGSVAVFIIAPLMAMLNNNSISKWISAFLYAVLIALFHNMIFIGFVIGLMIAHASAIPACVKFMASTKKYWVPVAFILGMYLCGYMVRGLYGGVYGSVTTGGFDTMKEYVYNSWGAGLLILAIMHCKPIQQFLELEPIRKLGEISFPLYLTHYIVMITFGAKLYLEIQHLGHAMATGIAVFVTILVMFAVAKLFDELVNKPVISVCKKITIRKRKSSNGNENQPQGSFERV